MDVTTTTLLGMNAAFWAFVATVILAFAWEQRGERGFLRSLGTMGGGWLIWSLLMVAGSISSLIR
jgi:hypothetical protein